MNRPDEAIERAPYVADRGFFYVDVVLLGQWIAHLERELANATDCMHPEIDERNDTLLAALDEIDRLKQAAVQDAERIWDLQVELMNAQ